MITNYNVKTITTQTPKGDRLDDIINEIQTLIAIPTDLIKCIFAIIISCQLQVNPPLWLLLVGVPSSSKTEIVSLFRGLSCVYFLDSFTMNPFASGYKPTKGEKGYDLLPELNGKCFICKDYTTIFSLNEETTKKLLGEMVSIYDGEFAKFSPTRGYQKYKSLFSHIGCITPAALNNHQRYLNIVGPRFMCYRIPALTEDKKKSGFEIAWNIPNRKENLKVIGEKCINFIEDILQYSSLFEINDKDTREKIDQLASCMAYSRGTVFSKPSTFTNDEGKQITYFDVEDIQVEEPWRALQQLKKLAICLALLDGRNEINNVDIEALKHIVLSSMPAERAEVLGYLITERSINTQTLSSKTGKSIRTCQRLVKELESLKIIKSISDGQLSKTYVLEESFQIFVSIPILPSESLSQLIPNKSVFSYSNEELEGVNQLILNFLRDNNSIAKDEKEKLLVLGEGIRQEALKRGILEISNLSFVDQLDIFQTANEV